MSEKFEIVLDTSSAEKELDQLEAEIQRVAGEISKTNEDGERSKEHVQSLIYQARVLSRKLITEFEKEHAQVLNDAERSSNVKAKEIEALIKRMEQELEAMKVKGKKDLMKEKFRLFAFRAERNRILLDTEMSIREKQRDLRLLKRTAIQQIQEVRSIVQASYSLLNQLLSMLGITMSPVLNAIMSAIFQAISAALTVASVGAEMGPYGIAMMALGLAGAAIGIISATKAEEEQRRIAAQIQQTQQLLKTKQEIGLLSGGISRSEVVVTL